MANDTTTTAEKLGWWDSIRAYFERRSLVMLMLGFASGLPNLLIFDTLSLWLREAGLSLRVISIFALATLCLLGLTVHAGARILHDCGVL